MKSIVDVHTHTIVSGHAYSTMSEMINAARDAGLKILGITEHGSSVPGTCDPLYFKNYWVVPRQYGDLRLLLGAELNILDYMGNIDMTEKDYGHMDLRLAGIHSVCWTPSTAEKNTDGVIAVMHNPWIHIITHPTDGTAELLMEPLVRAAKETGTLLELNSNSLKPARGKKMNRPNCIEMLKHCRHYDVPVIIGSDAHITFDVANHRDAIALIEEVGFPEELVLNDKPELFLELTGLKQ